MTTLVLTRGLPGSGKSTFAAEWVAEDPIVRARVNRDDLRFATYGKYVIGGDLERNITRIQQAQVEALLSAGVSVIVDDTNLRAATVKDWYVVAARSGSEVDFADFETPVEVCVARNAARAAAGGRDVPEAVIRDFAARYLRKGKLPSVPAQEIKTLAVEPVVDDPSLPKAILVDLDGTLATNKSGRGFYDWARVGEDDVVEAVRYAVRLYADNNVTPIFMTGRDAVCRDECVRWLYSKAGFAVDDESRFLHMRPAGSMEEDSKVKLDLFNKHVRGKYRVIGVFDDRISVARLWHSLGLPLFRVGDPDAVF